MTPEQRGERIAAGEALVKAAEAKFRPVTTRCMRCGFRPADHEPSNHEYVPHQDAFVEALRRFVEALQEPELEGCEDD